MIEFSTGKCAYSVGSCGSMLIAERSCLSPSFAMSMPSIRIAPESSSMIRNSRFCAGKRHDARTSSSIQTEWVEARFRYQYVVEAHHQCRFATACAPNNPHLLVAAHCERDIL